MTGDKWTMRPARAARPLAVRLRALGFTLIELLVALSIFVVLATMAYAALDSVLDTRDHVTRQVQRLMDIQMALTVIGRDIEQAAPRTVRDEFGDREPAMLSGNEGSLVLALTRNGWRNPAALARSNMQRVAYVLEDAQLLRRSWDTLDRVQESKPYEEVLLDDVTEVELRFLDSQLEWKDYWPPTDDRDEQQDALRPRAVELNIDIEGIGRITRLFRAATTSS